MSLSKKLLIIPGIAIGITCLVLAIKLKPAAPVDPRVDRARLVDTQVLAKQSSAPQIKGFGRVAPKHNWQAVAEVSGRLIYKNPLVEKGRLLPAGTLLLKIDPLEYELKLAQAEADRNASQAQLGRLDQQVENTKTSLAIEQERLNLANDEYQRKVKLKQKSLISSSDLENQKQQLLAQRKLVQDLESALKLHPDDRKVTLAQLKVNQARLEDSRRQLEKTELVLPFDARIAQVNIEEDQVVNVQSVMLEAYKLDMVEIEAQVSLQDMRNLVRSISMFPQPGQLPSIDKLKLNASVHLTNSGITFNWPANVTRVSETVNPKQGTVGIFLEVKQNYRSMDLSSNPPLAKGMYVQASIQGFDSEQFVVPERALHGNQIYLMDENNTLKVVPVTVLFRNKSGVAISGDIALGQRLILNDLIPAIPGMQLKTVENKQ